MAKMNKPTIVDQDFPSQLASDSEKESQEFGLKVAHAIQYQWFRKDGNSGCQYYDRWNEFYLRRLYARGEQPISKYKERFKVNGDLSYLNLDWSPVSFMAKFCDIAVNKQADRLFEPRAYAHDALSSEKRSLYQDTIEADMVAKPFLQQTKQQFGVDAFNVPEENLPENDQELQLHMQLYYKPAIEIAEEVAIANVLDMNDFYEVRKRYIRDIVEIGMGAMKHDYVPGRGIVVDYVDPEYIVHNFSEDPMFRDLFYFGEVKTVPIIELKKINPDLTKEQMQEVADAGVNWNNHYRTNMPYVNDMFNKDTVTILEFSYKTTKKFVYKKKFKKDGGLKMIPKDDSFNPEDNEFFARVEKEEEVWYSGVLVLGSDYLLKWELEKNLVKPESAFGKCIPKYILNAPGLYKGTIDSIVKRSMQFIDQIQMNWVKLQQVIQRVVPDGIYVDADGLSEIDLGDGSEYTPQRALDLYFQTGSVIGRSYTAEGEYNHAKVPIQQLSHNSGHHKIKAITDVIDYNLNMIRSTIGMNEAVDASTPNSEALVGVQKLAAIGSNNATKHIQDSWVWMTKKICEGVSVRIADILQYSDEAEEFANQIGKYHVSLLDDIKNLYLHSFGIFIDVAPNEEEKAQLEADIQIALNRDQIGLEDAYDIRSTRNLKLANELLKFKKKKKQQADQEAKFMEMEVQNQNNLQSQQAAAQAAAEKIQMETQSKISIKQAEAEAEKGRMEFEAMLKERLMDKEFQYNMQLRGLDTQALQAREDKKEDRKDQRSKQEATQQSKIAKQREIGGPPIDFESTEDTLDGFDLAEFGPK